MRHQDRSALAAHTWAQGARTPADTARSASPGRSVSPGSGGEGEPWPRLPGEQGEPPGPRNAPTFSPGGKDSGKRQSFPIARSIYSCICMYTFFVSFPPSLVVSYTNRDVFWEREAIPSPGALPEQPEQRLPPAPALVLPDCVLKPNAFFLARLFFSWCALALSK